jgi:Lar family restriction alleviation protein
MGSDFTDERVKHIGGLMPQGLNVGDSEGLLACPFCGGESARAMLDPAVRHRPHVVLCGLCGALGAHASSRKVAIATWNTRPTPTVPYEPDGSDAPIRGVPVEGWPHIVSKRKTTQTSGNGVLTNRIRKDK